MSAHSRPTDPLGRLKRRRRVFEVVSVMALIAALLWAIRPLAPIELPTATENHHTANGTESESAPDEKTPPPLDPSIFAAARLWNPLSEPIHEPATETPPVKPPALELVGIIEEDDGERYAAIYHIDRRELLIVRSGDRIEPYLVASITDETVRLENGRAVASLTVRRER